VAATDSKKRKTKQVSGNEDSIDAPARRGKMEREKNHEGTLPRQLSGTRNSRDSVTGNEIQADSAQKMDNRTVRLTAGY
jgi:hypothetical protein